MAGSELPLLHGAIRDRDPAPSFKRRNWLRLLSAGISSSSAA